MYCNFVHLASLLYLYTVSSVQITVGHWSISDHFTKMTTHIATWSVGLTIWPYIYWMRWAAVWARVLLGRPSIGVTQKLHDQERDHNQLGAAMILDSQVRVLFVAIVSSSNSSGATLCIVQCGGSVWFLRDTSINTCYISAITLALCHFNHVQAKLRMSNQRYLCSAKWPSIH